MSAAIPTILVLGGSGFYGHHVVRDLLQTTSASIVVAARNPHIDRTDPRLSTVAIDIDDGERLRDHARGADVMIHCAGPFTRLPLLPLDVAIELGVPYVDIAEDRGFAAGVRRRHSAAVAAGVPVMSGMSVCPAMEALAIRHLQPAFDSVTASRTYAAPDTKRHRGPAMFETMLFGAGRRFDQPNGNRGREAYGWTEPEWFVLPPPIGKRLTFRIHDMADVDLLPAAFGLDYVAFKAGSEWPLLNALVGVAGQIRRRTGHPDWRRIGGPARVLSRIVGSAGRPEGGVAFEVTGIKDGQETTQSIAITSEADGGQIPSLLASIAAQALLAGRYTRSGVADIGGWIDPADWIDAMSQRGLGVWHRSDRREPWVLGTALDSSR